jgi:hypothetical protein
MGDFEGFLTAEIVDSALRSGSELVIPFEGATRAVRIARENHIAVLGVEVFRVLPSGLGVEAYSGYEFDLRGNWDDFVRLNDDGTLRFIEENRFDEGYGYILTAVSEDEFGQLRKPITAPDPRRYKSSGRNPVCFPTRLRILRPSSSPSWNENS